MGNSSASKEETPTNLPNKNPLLDTISGHQGGINCMALSEDLSILATGSEDSTIRLWTTKTKKCQCIGVLTGHTGYISCLLIEEVYVLSGSSDNKIIKWDMATCENVHVYHGHTGHINKLLSTGDFLFSSSNDATLKCWDLDTGELIRDFVGHASCVFPVLFIPSNDFDSSDGDESASVNDVLVTGSTDLTARSWSFETGEQSKVFAGHHGVISSLATTLEGRLLFTASSDCTVRSWRLETGEVLKVYEGHTASVLCLTVVNRTLFTGGPDRMVRAWPVDWMAKEFTDFQGHSNTISNLDFHQGLLFASGADGTVTCYDSRSAEFKKSFPGAALTAVNSVKFVESRMFTGSTDGLLRVWSLQGLRKPKYNNNNNNNNKDNDNNKDNNNNKDNVSINRGNKENVNANKDLSGK